jgi:VWFA-related protein
LELVSRHGSDLESALTTAAAAAITLSVTPLAVWLASRHLLLCRYDATDMRGVVALVLTVSAAAAVSQQEIPLFKSGVDVVQFNVNVLDKDRRPVTGLTASDFDVLVDGQPRPLAAFAAVTLAGDSSVSGAEGSPIPSDVTTNRLAPEGRVVVIVMDRSTPIGQPMQAARAVANSAIDHLGPDDLAAVIFTGAFARKYAQDFTTDRARLHAAVAKAVMGADPSKRVQLASEEQSGECMCGVCVPDALTAIARTLTGGTLRHKSIIFVGSDIAVATRATGSTCEARIHSARERLSRALDEANVTFHVVDPRGLEPLGDSAENAAPVGNADRTANLFREESLAVLPDYTGGRVVLNTNRPVEAIGPLFDESRAYYVLAVARDAPVAGGADRHRIKISVKQSGAIVRARNLYFAADPKTEPTTAGTSLAAALRDSLPGGDFSLQMNLAAQFAADGSPEVGVLLAADSAIAGKLDVVIATYDRVLTLVGTPLKQRLDVPPGAVAGGATFQWTAVVKPPPGDYEVRAAVATADGQRAAHVIGYIDVPDAKKEEVALSGIIVKSGGAATVRREFAGGDAVGLSFQVAHAKSGSADVAVHYVLKDERGQPIANATVPHDRAVRVAPRVEGYDMGIRLPAGPGRYVVTIEASDGRRAARREVLLRVR